MTFRATALVLALLTSHAVAGTPVVEVYKHPDCGCCGLWVEHLKQNGFDVKVRDVADVGAIRNRLGMPEKFAACHTAKVGDYLVEGHVPAADVKRLLVAKPKALGIAVPSMPPGSPGMPSPKPVAYETLLVQPDGSYTTYARH
ncbi:MAG: DUF411 domain-containing protein [Rhodocyclales bacterium]|nr:DUF411 domain-containing protein [Rhodocyclales bacterium]